jgi:hypothetical protein
MSKAVFWAAAVFAAAIFFEDAQALTPADVARIMCCCDKGPNLRGCRPRFRRVPGGCKNDFGLSVQG